MTLHVHQPWASRDHWQASARASATSSSRPTLSWRSAASLSAHSGPSRPVRCRLSIPTRLGSPRRDLPISRSRGSPVDIAHRNLPSIPWISRRDLPSIPWVSPACSVVSPRGLGIVTRRRSHPRRAALTAQIDRLAALHLDARDHRPWRHRPHHRRLQRGAEPASMRWLRRRHRHMPRQ